VGQANGNNPIPIVIPCHRVVLAPGRATRRPGSGHASPSAASLLGGYSGGDGLATKRWLLALEARTKPLP
jgi:methylated-DNA-[protein]-cysteine S-methyltransferase